VTCFCSYRYSIFLPCSVVQHHAQSTFRRCVSIFRLQNRCSVSHGSVPLFFSLSSQFQLGFCTPRRCCSRQLARFLLRCRVSIARRRPAFSSCTPNLHRGLLVGSSKGCDFYAIFCEVSCELLQELFPVLISSHRIKRLEDSWFKSFSHGNFLNASIRCLMK
jgi:hypothetical protein